MPSTTRQARFVFFSALGLVPLLLACNFVTSVLNDGGLAAVTPSPGGTAPTEPGPTATPAQEMMTIYTVQGGETQVPVPPPVSYSELLEERVEDGTWTRGQGIALLLSFLAGERTAENIPSFEEVLVPQPSGLIERADLYLEDPERDPEYAAEIERLLRVLVPSQEALDRISQPARQSQQRPLQPVMHNPQGDDSDPCARVEGDGFDAKLDTGEHCYEYLEWTEAGARLRVYYPKHWQQDSEQYRLVELASLTLEDSVEVYGDYGSIDDINFAFSLSHPEGYEAYAAYQSPFAEDEACPITALPLATEQDLADYEQLIAHEVFHCFQHWNLIDQEPGNSYDWWQEGSAEYFSNLVYPRTNLEHRALDKYYLESLSDEWFEMSYENFLLMQYLGNRFGPDDLIELLDELGAAQTIVDQEIVLADYPDMHSMYQQFVVATMSNGIEDTGGGRIVAEDPPVRRIQSIEQAAEEEFEIFPFQAGRFAANYLQEHYYLQEVIEGQYVRYDSVDSSQRKDPASWGDLPSEIRTECSADELHFVAMSAIDGIGTLTADVSTASEAQCDPCLLGTWQLDYEDHPNVSRALEESGGGTGLDVEVSGFQYLQFSDRGSVQTRMADMTTSLAGLGGPAIEWTANAHGGGIYSADGERLRFFDVTFVIDHIQTSVEGMGVMETTPDFITAALPDGFIRVPNLFESEGESDADSPYVCTEETLSLEHPFYGEQLFERTEEPIPTPVSPAK